MESGEMPEEWKEVRIGDVCIQRNEIIQPSGKGEHKFVGLEHIKPGEIEIQTYQLDTDVKSSKFRFYRGDILYGKLRPYLDKAAIADFDGICSTDLLVLTNVDNKVSAGFLVYLIHSNQFIQNSISATSGTNHPRTSWKEISKFKFGLPPLPEQRRIAEVLGTVDSAIQKVGGAIERTERLKKGLMQRLLTRGIGHERFKESEVGGVPEEWEVARLGEVLTDISYGTSVKANDENQGLPVLGIPNILSGKIDENNLRYVYLSEQEKQNLTLKVGDVLIVRTNANSKYIGRSALFENKTGTWVYASYLIRIRVDTKKVIPNYLIKFLQSEKVRRQFLSIARTSAGNYNINTQGIRSINICLPNIFEQRRIAEILSAVDRKLELERRRKEKLERVKKGLMDELLTGRKRVKADK